MRDDRNYINEDEFTNRLIYDSSSIDEDRCDGDVANDQGLESSSYRLLYITHFYKHLKLYAEHEGHCPLVIKRMSCQEYHSQLHDGSSVTTDTLLSTCSSFESVDFDPNSDDFTVPRKPVCPNCDTPSTHASHNKSSRQDIQGPLSSLHVCRMCSLFFINHLAIHTYNTNGVSQLANTLSDYTEVCDECFCDIEGLGLIIARNWYSFIPSLYNGGHNIRLDNAHQWDVAIVGSKPPPPQTGQSALFSIPQQKQFPQVVSSSCSSNDGSKTTLVDKYIGSFDVARRSMSGLYSYLSGTGQVNIQYEELLPSKTLQTLQGQLSNGTRYRILDHDKFSTPTITNVSLEKEYDEQDKDNIEPIYKVSALYNGQPYVQLFKDTQSAEDHMALLKEQPIALHRSCLPGLKSPSRTIPRMSLPESKVQRFHFKQTRKHASPSIRQIKLQEKSEKLRKKRECGKAVKIGSNNRKEKANKLVAAALRDMNDRLIADKKVALENAKYDQEDIMYANPRDHDYDNLKQEREYQVKYFSDQIKKHKCKLEELDDKRFCQLFNETLPNSILTDITTPDVTSFVSDKVGLLIDRIAILSKDNPESSIKVLQTISQMSTNLGLVDKLPTAALLILNAVLPVANCLDTLRDDVNSILKPTQANEIIIREPIIWQDYLTSIGQDPEADHRTESRKRRDDLKFRDPKLFHVDMNFRSGSEWLCSSNVDKGIISLELLFQLLDYRVVSYNTDESSVFSKIDSLAAEIQVINLPKWDFVNLRRFVVDDTVLCAKAIYRNRRAVHDKLGFRPAPC
jgi:hypothetical protein